MRDRNGLLPRQRRRLAALWRLHKGLFLLLAGLTVALLATLAVLSISEARITLPSALTARIEARVDREMPRLDLSLGRITVGLDRQAVPRLWLQDVGLREAGGRDLARLSEIGVAFDPVAALRGRVAPRVLRISGADLVIRRDAEGRFELAVGGTGGFAMRPPAALLDALDAGLASPPFNRAERIELSDIGIRLEDARSGRVWQLTAPEARLVRGPDGTRIAIEAELFNGSDDVAGLRLALSTDAGDSAAQFSATLDGVAAGDVALQSPALSFLQVIEAPLSGSLEAAWDAAGGIEALSGTFEIGAGELRPRPGTPPLDFDAARADFSFDPERQELRFAEISARGDAGHGRVSGRVLLREPGPGGFPREFVGQLDIEKIEVGAEALFPVPVSVEGGSADLRLRLDPFTVDIGRMIVPAAGPDAPPLRLSGQVTGRDDGWHVAVDATVERLASDVLKSAWPLPVAPKVRAWLAKNVAHAALSEVAAALRYDSGDPKPELSLSFLFDEGEIRALKTLPPITGGRGFGSITDHRLALSLESGGVEVPGRGRLDLSGTTMVVPDSRIKPAPAKFEIETEGPLPALLVLLDEEPFRFLSKAGRTPDLADGRVRLHTSLALPLKKGIRPPDIALAAQGEITDLASEKIVKGRELRAERMRLAVTKETISAEGEATVAGVPFDGRWEQAIGGEGRGTGRVTGEIGVSPAGLAAFGIALPDGLLSGSGQADLDLALTPGTPPAIELTSDLRGLTLAIPAVNWSKPAETAGRFRLEGRLSEVPQIDTLVLEAPGLAARGRVRLAEGPRFEALKLDRVQLGGWLDGAVTIRSRGRGAPPAISVSGGTVDIRRARIGGSGGGGARGPVSLRLDRLTVTDTVALTGFALDVPPGRGLTGRFSGRVNGGVPVEGALEDGAIRLESANAGAVLRDAGLVDRVSGGAMELTLTPAGGRGSYDGTLRVQGIRLYRAPAMAKLLSAVSVVGLIDQLEGQGIVFDEVAAEFRLTPSRITLYSSSATGASLGLSMDGVFDPQAKVMDMQGVISPFYLLNRVGSVFTRRGEGLFGVSFTLRGPVADPAVSVNPLSLLTPGTFREIFRRPPPSR